MIWPLSPAIIVGVANPLDSMSGKHQKDLGQYFTPDDVVRTLVSWAVRNDTDRLLDPSCGDGRFLEQHANSVGIEQDPGVYEEAQARAPAARIHEADFFTWASSTTELFDCAAGNPPFIRYQRFKGPVRERARKACADLGATFSGLSSSWAPFLVVTASLIRDGGRMAFVVPAEIGHAPYARPLLDFMMDNFDLVKVVAVKTKLFPQLSEDAWLLYAEGKGGSSTYIEFTTVDKFQHSARPPEAGTRIDRQRFDRNRGRLRRFLAGNDALELYEEISREPHTSVFGDVARVGIGYVTGANSFFHMRPSEARAAGIPQEFLRPTVRSGRYLNGADITDETVTTWLEQDLPVLLLDLPRSDSIPRVVSTYLESREGKVARKAYKCRVRTPWYSVPDVSVPDGFLSYMSGGTPSLVANEAACSCTNSVHAVRLQPGFQMPQLKRAWESPVTRLSCELEGHPLGGGMLKLEPGEASKVLLDFRAQENLHLHNREFSDATRVLREWRHSAESA